MKKITFVLPLVVTACAQSPDSIAPAYVSNLQYANLSCEQIAQELDRTHAALSQASQQQLHARSADTWGVVLLGLPTASLSGENVAPQIATYKGQENAMHEAMVKKNCPAQAPAGT